MKVVFDDGSPETRLEQEFNGLTWRTLKRSDTDADGDLDEERVFSYSASWQLLEERVDRDHVGDPGVDRRVQIVWGLRYIDDCILHRADGNGDGDYGDSVAEEGIWYHLTDAMFSTVALIDDGAQVLERVTYSAYGEARHHRLADLDGNGQVNGSDQGTLLGVWGQSIGENGYHAEADFNRDGDTDGDDLGSLFGSWGAALAPGLISFAGASAPENPIGWDGYVFNPAPGDYLVRNRTYIPPLGRWGQRDPAGYVDGASLYQFANSQPIALSDYSGLVADMPYGHPSFLPGGRGLSPLRIPEDGRIPLLETTPPILRPWNQNDECPSGTEAIWVCRGRLNGDTNETKYNPSELSHSYVACANPFTDPSAPLRGKHPRAFASPGELKCYWVPVGYGRFGGLLRVCIYVKNPLKGPGYIEDERRQVNPRDPTKATCKKRCVDPECKARLCRDPGPSDTPYGILWGGNCHHWAEQCPDLSGRGIQ